MPVSYKRQDDLDKMLEEFASFDHLEHVEFPEDKEKGKSQKERN